MIKRLFYIFAAASAIFAFAGCTDTSPKLDADTTPPPSFSSEMPTEEASSTPDIMQEPDTTDKPDELSVDALGNTIYGSDHFERYITFTNIDIYDENGDTFVDLIAENAYPDELFCAVNIEFFNDQGATIATGNLQMNDGSFMLKLHNGKTRLYARVLTDTKLTDKEFELSFDPQTGVKPE